jgi:predicted permease
MRTLIQDLRYCARLLRRSPGFTAAAVVIMALGIGANTAIFSLTDQMLLRLLPVKNPEELVLLTGPLNHIGSNTGANALSYPMYRDFRERNQVFADMMCRFEMDFQVSFGGAAERTLGELVSGNYFEMLGVGAALGRLITPDDDRTPGGHPVAVLSYSYWVNRLGRDPEVIGRKFTVNGYPMTIVGVSAEGFEGLDFANAPAVRVPVAMHAQMAPGVVNWLTNRRQRWVQVFGRLKPGLTMAQAKAGLQPIYKAIIHEESKAFSGVPQWAIDRFLQTEIDTLPGSQGRSFTRRRAELPLKVLSGAVIVVLLIACSNVAGLLMARMAARTREVAVRLSIGASRGRLVRQLLTESFVLAAMGGLAGLALAVPAQRWLINYLPTGIGTTTLSAEPDPRMLLFSLLATAATALLIGLTPAWQATRVDLATRLKDQANAVAGGRARLRKCLVVAQLALSLILLAGSALFLRSLANLRAHDTGLRMENVVTFKVDPRLNGYAPLQAKALHRDLLARLRALPGVHAAGLSTNAVLEGSGWDSSVNVEGYQSQPGENMNPYFNAVSPDYFKSVGMRLLAGRDFTPQDARTDLPAPDQPNSFRAIIANEAFVRKHFGDRDPIGRRIGFGNSPGAVPDMVVVGVVSNARNTSIRETEQRQLFVPFFEIRLGVGATYYVRTALPPERMYAEVRKTVAAADPALPIYAMFTLENKLDRLLTPERLVATLSGVFGVLAVGLAAMGLYGVLAFTVAARTKEIGLRVALGAARRDVVKLVAREVALLAAAGIAIGLPAAVGLSSFVRALLFGIEPSDVASLGGATLLIALVAAAGALAPAWRASRIEPGIALRYE